MPADGAPAGVPAPWSAVGRGFAIAGVIAFVGVGAYLAGRRSSPPAPPPIAPAAPPIASASATAAPSAAPSASATSNRWVKIEPVATTAQGTPWLLGVDADAAPPEVRGFRPSRKVAAPSRRYEIQAHEVTWAELEPFFSANPSYRISAAASVPADARAKLPASGVPWATAAAYCASIGGALPSEEEWEHAARGAGRAPFPWGDAKLDAAASHVFGGPDARPAPIMASPQDRTSSSDDALFDLAGNVREWTDGPYRDDVEAEPPAWSAAYRAVRGLPLRGAADGALAQAGVAHRAPGCASDACAAAAAPVLVALAADPKRDASDAGIDAGKELRAWLAKLAAAPEAAKCLEPAGPSGGTMKLAFAPGTLRCMAKLRGGDSIVIDLPRCSGDSESDDESIAYTYLDGGAARVTIEGLPAGAPGACLKEVAERLLKDAKWTAAAAWTATVWLAAPAAGGAALADVGFRCVRRP
jgi:formylglycine-generating enzyme required for sulfatase activity